MTLTNQYQFNYIKKAILPNWLLNSSSLVHRFLSCYAEFEISRQVHENHRGHTFICQSAIMALKQQMGKMVGPGLSRSLTLPCPSVPALACQTENVREQALLSHSEDFCMSFQGLGTAVCAARAKVSVCGQLPTKSQCFIFCSGRRKKCDRRER